MSGNRIDFAQLQKLPVEILFEIFSYLNPLDLGHLGQTNHFFRRKLGLDPKTEQVTAIMNSLWQYKFQLHFPHRIKEVSAEVDKTGWYVAFKKIYTDEYKSFGKDKDGLRLKRLFTAVKDGDLAYLQISKLKIEELLGQDKFNNKLLYWAAFNRHQHILNYCDEKIIDPAYPDQEAFKQIKGQQVGIMYWKVVCNQEEAIENLLAKDVNAVCAYKVLTPLFVAAQYRHLKVVQALIKAGANVNQARTDTGATPLYIAAYHGHVEIVKVLLEAGVNVNQARIDTGTTPLYVAAQNGHVEGVKVLLEAGAKVNQAVTGTGITPLYIAAQKGYLEVVDSLVKAGAKIDIEDQDGKTAYDMASSQCKQFLTNLELIQKKK